MESIFRKKTRPCKTPYPKQPAATAHPLSKAMVFGAVLLVCSAFVLLRSQAITALLLGTFGLALLVAGATKQAALPPVPPAISVKKFCKNCAAICQPDWEYCAKCSAPLTNEAVQHCPYCGLVTNPGWRFCPYCTKEIV